MGVSDVDSNQLDQQINDAVEQKTPALTPASAIYQKGAYSISGYKAALQTWYRKFNSFKKEPNSKSLSSSQGKQYSLHDIGMSNTAASTDFTWPSIISFGASFNKEEKRESMKVDEQDFKLDIKFTYGDMQAFTINPGTWCVDRFRSPFSTAEKTPFRSPEWFESYQKTHTNFTYPNLLDGAPKQVRNLVRPIQILCGSAIGLEVTFSGSAKESFDSLHETYTKTDGGVRIFGFNVGLSRQTSDVSATHEGTWDRQSGHLSVKPVDGAGWCTLLGVLGEKLTIDD